MHDGVGVVLKRFIKKTQLDVQGLELKNAKQVFLLLREKLSGELKVHIQVLQQGLSFALSFM
jgi:hypothetical protein